MLTPDEQRMLTYALDQAQDDIWTKDGFTETDQDALTSLRRLTTGPTTERRVYAWAQTIDTADGGTTVHIPGTHYNGSGPETSAIVVRREDVPVLTAMLTKAQRECSASISGNCLREQEGDTEAGECVHGGQPAVEEAHPSHSGWFVELRMNDGHWAVAFPTHDRDKAVERLTLNRQRSPQRQWRLVQHRETYTVEETP